jgi:hypothetical protein
MTPVARLTVITARLLAMAAAALLPACGMPPQPLPSAPPEAAGSAGTPSAYPSVGMPVFPAPSESGPAGGYPTVALPTLPTTVPKVTASPPPPRPSPAPACAHGPTAAQVVAVVKTRPGIPTGPALEAKQGPYCAGTWQFTVLGETGKTLDQVDPLLVVTTGRPPALTVVEAGADVCSSHVEHAAPSGIRVLACGS